MNERLKQLYSEAALYAFNQRFIPGVVRELQEVITEKFAELIVQKCVAQCEFVAGQAEITNTGEMARKTKATADNCAFWIKEYFGVEE